MVLKTKDIVAQPTTPLVISFMIVPLVLPTQSSMSRSYFMILVVQLEIINFSSITFSSHSHQGIITLMTSLVMESIVTFITQ